MARGCVVDSRLRDLADFDFTDSDLCLRFTVTIRFALGGDFPTVDGAMATVMFGEICSARALVRAENYELATGLTPGRVPTADTAEGVHCPAD